MARVEVEKDRDGRSRVIWFGRKITDTSLLVELQGQISQFVPSATLVRNSRLHKTDCKFGRWEELRACIFQSNPSLTETQFEDAFCEMVLRIQTVKAGRAVVNGQSLAVWENGGNPLVVLKLQKTDELVKTRKVISGEVKAFLKICGIEDLDQFICSYPQMRYQLDVYNPHITLARLRGMTTLSIDVYPISIGLEPPQLMNVRINN